MSPTRRASSRSKTPSARSCIKHPLIKQMLDEIAGAKAVRLSFCSFGESFKKTTTCVTTSPTLARLAEDDRFYCGPHCDCVCAFSFKPHTNITEQDGPAPVPYDRMAQELCPSCCPHKIDPTTQTGCSGVLHRVAAQDPVRHRPDQRQRLTGLAAVAAVP